MSRRKKKNCRLPACQGQGEPLFCGEHYGLLTPATKTALRDAKRRGVYELHRKGETGQSLIDKALAEIQKRLDGGTRPGAWRGHRPAPRFLGNGRSDE